MTSAEDSTSTEDAMSSENTTAGEDTAEDDGPSSTLPRRQLGRFLRESRDATGFTIARAVKQVDLSRAVLQRIETGQIQKISRPVVQALCELYDVSREDTDAAVDLAAQGRAKSWHHIYGGMFSSAFNMYIGLESAARRLTTCDDQCISGLLQSADYARAIISASPLFNSREDVERRVRLRMKRQALITRRTRPIELDAVLHISALYRVVGGTKTMAVARQIAELSTRPNITVRIQPYSAGQTWGIPHGSFTILDFERTAKGVTIEPPVVFIDGGASPFVYLEKPDEIRRYRELVAAIRDTCLDEVQSRSLLRQVAKEYERSER